MGTIDPLFERLVDDAAVFPPRELDLQAAVKAHGDHHASWYGPFVGALLCPASRLNDLDILARQLPEPVGVTVVIDTGTGGLTEAVDVVAQSERLALRGVELPLRGDILADSARRTVAGLDSAMGGSDDDEPGYIEVPRIPGWQNALDIIAESGYRAKLRTGGAAADAQPTASELASFILACLDRAIAFKFTAGLHRAVRHPTAGGVTEHGFLNTLVAVATALDGGDQDAVISTLLIDEAETLATMVRELPDGRATSLRRWYSSYGSCSIAEPLADLVGLGLITEPNKVSG